MNVLMDIKTNIPVNDKFLVTRKNVFKDIDIKLTDNSRFLIVSAPAGYGKTTLIAEWLENKDYRKSWVSLFESDIDSSMFFSGIITALQKIDKEFFKGVEDIIEAQSLPEINSLLSIFIDEINKLDENLVLVIDNYHLMNNDYIHNFIEKFINFIPNNMFLIILTREKPSLMLNRYKINGQMSEIGIEDLSFNFDEIVKLYNDILNLKIKKSSIEKIYSRSEGWIAGIKLAGLELINKEVEETYQFINNFSGSHSYIKNYLMEEVLDGLDETTKEFIFKTSIADNVCPGLCNYLTDRSDSNEILKKLEKMNLFLFSLGPNKQWYRYHQLFKDSLSTYLSPALKKELLIKESVWLREAGYYKEAIIAAVKTEDFNLAVQNAVEAIPEYLEKGEINKLLELLNLIPEKYIFNNGFLLIIKAWSLFLTGSTENGLFYLNIIHRKPQLIEGKNKEHLLMLNSLPTLTKEINKNSNIQEKLEEVTTYAEKDQIFKLISLGQINAYHGELQSAVNSFKKAYFLARELGQVFMEILSIMNYSLLLNQTGELQTAITVCESNIARFKVGANSSLASLLYLPLGIFNYELGHYKVAKKYLGFGLEMSSKRELAYVYYYAKLYLAKANFELSDYKTAFEIIDNTIEYTKQNHMDLERKEIENLKMEFDLRLGKDINLIENKDRFYNEICKKQINTLNIKYILTYCRLLINIKEYDKVQSYLRDLRDFSNKKTIHEDKITIFLLSAITVFHFDQKERANDFLLEAIKIKGSEKYISVFTKEGKSLYPLLIEFKNLAPNFIEKIKNIIKNNFGHFSGEVAQDKDKLMDPLTDRELEILKLVAKGLSNKKIAEKLVITTGTTKWHLSNVYSKLAVSKRTQAVAKAMELEII